MQMSPYRVLVVDDSAFMRKVVSDLIEDDPEFTVISTAKNGKEAIEKVKELKPDVITMDVEMPEMNGLDALRFIMSEQPTPVIMLSSLTSDGARETILALEWGAIDFVRKPSGSISLDLYKVKILLIEKLKIAVNSRVRKQNLPTENKQEVREPKASVKAKSLESNLLLTKQKITNLIAVGTSTGGPKALQQILTPLPELFPAPILIVQHMPPKFTKSLAQRLDAASHITVVEAEDGQEVRNGIAYVAPGGWHMQMIRGPMQGYKIKLTKEEPKWGHRPSVDILFESLTPFIELKRHAVIMTGMGSDGARGMKALQAAGLETGIAEAEETCVVYGMPRAAVELNCIDHVLPLQEIPNKLMQLLPS